ncbi:MAG: type V CRISPR-associated protein Cas12k, partial [Planktothrix sp.]|uniref:type V CRISPR-associated protein Cas12k n=2 Tax=Planktothrix sp. TaxID=3088171 RepID=UPI0038D4FC0A
KSWIKLQQRLQRKLDGQTHWISMLKSDEELVEQSQSSLESIRTKATELLALLKPIQSPPQTQLDNKKKRKSSKSSGSLTQTLFDTYSNTEDNLTRAAICYLLKNGQRVPNELEDPQKFTQRRRKAEIKLERITEQLESSCPKGRELTGQKWLETLLLAVGTVPNSEAEAKRWQDQLITKSPSIAFPVNYETNEDLTWSKNSKNRLCVQFNGLAEYHFEIYCDQRQLPYFQRFLEDQTIKRNSKNQHSSALFTLRSGRIVWQEGTGKGQPWKIHHLRLYCTVDTRLWTTEGTEQVRQEKASEIAQILTRMEEKGELNEKQQAFIQRKNSTLARINNPFPRPSQPLYQGQPHLLLGVSLGLKTPATVAIVDGITGKAITYRSVRQLLGKNYKFINRQQQQKRRLAHQRHQAQKQFANNSQGDSELGQYLDRLLAQAIVNLAKTYQVGSIVLPKLGEIRENIQAEIKLRAEQKIPHCEEAQKQYAKQYRVSIHQWSYGRLMETIRSFASQLGIVIEEGQQTIRGSPQEQAKGIALSAYQSRSLS